MSAVHHFNQGIIGPNNQAQYPDAGGVWNISNASWEGFVNPTPVSSDLGWSHDEPDSGNEYTYSGRNLTVFYTDSYGTTTHVDQGTGTKGSYTDARQIGNNQGNANSNTLLVNYNNSKVGYKWSQSAKIIGFKANGKYSTRTFSNNGTLDILTWDGAQWTEYISDVDISEGGTIDWGENTPKQYTFATPKICKGLAIQCNNVSTYWTISYFAPLIENNVIFLGHT